MLPADEVGNELWMSGSSTLNIDTTPYDATMNIYGDGQSRINIRGGEYYSVNLNDQSKLDFSNGYIHDLYIQRWDYYNPQATYISGGLIERLYDYGYNNVFNVSGGVVGDASQTCSGNNIFNISGGQVYGLNGGGDMVINVIGGLIGNYIEMHDRSILNIQVTPYESIWIGAFGQSNINITGGDYAEVLLNDESILSFRNGWAETVNVSGDAYAIIDGGEINQLLVSGTAEVELWEGALVNYIFAQDLGIIKIYGRDLVYDEGGGIYGGGQLLGFWLDGRPLTLDLKNAQDDSTYYNHIVLIPEPMTLLLIGLGGFMLRKK